MPISMRNPYEDPDSSTNNRVVVDVLLLSLLAHAAIITAIILITVFMPMPKIMLLKSASPTVSLSLMPPPPVPAVPKKPLFVPTMPDANAPHKVQPIESANDTTLKSKSQTARAPESIMPDVNGKEHNPDLNESPKIPQVQKPEVSSTPPTPKQFKLQKPTPPQPPTPQQALKPVPKPPAPTPPKPTPSPDNPNGLPVLPQINAPTLAMQTQSTQPLAPAASQLEQATSVHGAISPGSDNSPAAMATDLGKYKQYICAVVGSYWYPDIDKHFGTIGVGTVAIRFTIHSDGTISDVTILGGDDQILRNISRNALVAPAPYKPFSESMVKEVGDSFTEDFTFSIYGN